MKPIRFERKWKGYKFAACRADGCAGRVGDGINYEGLCRACNDKGLRGDLTAGPRTGQHDNRGNTVPNAGWRAFKIQPPRAPRPDPRPKR